MADQSVPTWVILTSRYGGDTRNPSAQDLVKAAHELFNESIPGMMPSDYAEHPSAWLRFGSRDGAMIVLEVDRHGAVSLERWADQDYERELAPAVRWTVGTPDEVVRLWSLLAEGRFRELTPDERPGR
jgi:hypothetical protein